MPDPVTPTHVNRRDFGLTIAAVALTVGANDSAVAEGTPEKEVIGKPTDPVEKILELIRQDHPHARLDPAAIEEIRTDIEQHRLRSALLSTFPLTNGDEPGGIFRAYRND